MILIIGIQCVNQMQQEDVPGHHHIIHIIQVEPPVLNTCGSPFLVTGSLSHRLQQVPDVTAAQQQNGHRFLAEIKLRKQILGGRVPKSVEKAVLRVAHAAPGLTQPVKSHGCFCQNSTETSCLIASYLVLLESVAV